MSDISVKIISDTKLSVKSSSTISLEKTQFFYINGKTLQVPVRTEYDLSNIEDTSLHPMIIDALMKIN